MHKKYFSIIAVVFLVSSAATLPGRIDSRPAANGSVEGVIHYTGTPPKMKPIDMAKEPSCASQHAKPVLTESVTTDEGNTLEDVVVYVSAGDQGPAVSTPVEYDQKGCQYVPHVAAMRVGQPLEISNHDQTSHNIHPMAKANSEWNKSQPPGSPAIKVTYDKAEFIPVKCNVHPWMHGYFAVLPTSHFAVSGNDGKFSLKGLPPGKYTLTAWQERFGTQTAEVTVTSGGTTKTDFTFKAVPY